MHFLISNAHDKDLNAMINVDGHIIGYLLLFNQFLLQVLI